MKTLMCVLSLVLSMSSQAGEVAFGTVKGIKLYDFSGDKSIRVYFHSDATYVNEACVHDGHPIAVINKVNHDEPTIDRMLSMLLSAQMAGQKVRVHAEGDDCEVDFIAIQDTLF